MRLGKEEKANALAVRIGSEIISYNSGRLKREAGDFDSKDLWSAVRDITGKNRTAPTFFCADASSLNTHYSTVSTDPAYVQPDLKLTCLLPSTWLSEIEVFRTLDKIKPTAPGPDLLPSCFLKLGAPFFTAPVLHLFNFGG